MVKKSVSIWVEPSDWNRFQEHSKLLHGKSANKRINEFMQTENAKDEGQVVQPCFDYGGKESELRKLIRDEESLAKDLQKEILDNKHSAYEELCAFAAKFGSDKTLTTNSEKVLYALHHYRHTGAEPFTKKHLELFIQLYEIAIKRRVLQAELDRHRRNGLNKV